MSTALQREWKAIAIRFELTVDCPFSVRLRNFGGAHGMLLVTAPDTVLAFSEQLVALGFGYRCLFEPKESDFVDETSLIEMLMDWGWTGEGRPPGWMPSDAIQPQQRHRPAGSPRG